MTGIPSSPGQEAQGQEDSRLPKCQGHEGKLSVGILQGPRKMPGLVAN